MNEKLIVLGTGNANAVNCFNTCFALQNANEYLLVDAGGGNGILKQLKEAGIPLSAVKNMIVTHAHTDHVLGVIWVLRMIATAQIKGSFSGEFRVYGHKELLETVRTLCSLTLQKKHLDRFDNGVRFIPVSDGETLTVGPWRTVFFDIRSTKMKQYGFSLTLQNGRILTCLGDEPYNPACRQYAENADWLLSEAFCLYADRDIFHPYEKHHSTVKDAAALASELHAKQLVLWHTEDTDLCNRKAKYTAEAKTQFGGEIYVPDDLETLTL